MKKASGFAISVAAELARARAQHKPINSAHEGYAVILEELDEFKAEVFKKRQNRDPYAMLAELIHIGAMAERIADDVVMELLPSSSSATSAPSAAKPADLGNNDTW
jgi:hypothetical protein